MGPGGVQCCSEAAGVGPGPAPVTAAGVGEVGVPVPHSRPHQSSGSGCEAEAATAGAGGRKGGAGTGRSLLAQLLMGFPAVAGGAQHRAGLEPGGGAVGGEGQRWGDGGGVQREM